MFLVTSAQSRTQKGHIHSVGEDGGGAEGGGSPGKGLGGGNGGKEGGNVAAARAEGNHEYAFVSIALSVELAGETSLVSAASFSSAFCSSISSMYLLVAFAKMFGASYAFRANFESPARSIFDKDSSGTRMRAVPNRVPAAHLHAVFALPRCCGPDATISGIYVCMRSSSHGGDGRATAHKLCKNEKEINFGRKLVAQIKKIGKDQCSPHHSRNISDFTQIVHPQNSKSHTHCNTLTYLKND